MPRRTGEQLRANFQLNNQQNYEDILAIPDSLSFVPLPEMEHQNALHESFQRIQDNPILLIQNETIDANYSHLHSSNLPTRAGAQLRANNF